jgi:hypothetical protein
MNIKTSPASRSRPPYLALAVYAAAMAYLEAAVVVYLRELFHPAGFSFPLMPIEPRMAVAEIGREVATVIMIGAVAQLAGGCARDRFAAFAFVFGVWDILYYAWLKILIGWPQGWFDPDVLFLIPEPWVGPVIAPMLVALFLILLAFILRPARPGETSPPRIGILDWALLLAGAALVLWSFLEPNLGTAALDRPAVYPERYAWEAFCAGLLLGAIALARIARRRRAIS